jgi:stearoyl-CoA desaturase (delta-9 desaturase)
MSTATVPQPVKAGYQPHRLPYPASVLRHRLIWPYAFAFTVYHLLALLAFVPWLFSWTGVVLAVSGLYLFGTLGINLCFHRLLTHRGFACPRWLEYLLSLIGVCCLQDTPARWVAVHRLHHQNSDEQSDPHSPLVTFFWGHMDWLIRTNTQLERMQLYEHYAKDLLRRRFYMNLERRVAWVWINFAQWLLYYSVGFVIGWATGGTWLDGVQFGLSVWLWGVIVRTVLVWHITWSVNSVTHLWGYRNYETGENSRNNWFVGLVSNGEGWHNNHHAQPRCAAHGHKWWEFDVTWITIWLLGKVGLAWNIVQVRPQKATEVVPLTQEDITPPD